jgi:hypothetical protein
VQFQQATWSSDKDCPRNLLTRSFRLLKCDIAQEAVALPPAASLLAVLPVAIFLLLSAIALSLTTHLLESLHLWVLHLRCRTTTFRVAIPLVALAAKVQLVLLLAPPSEVLANTTVLLGILLVALPMLDLLSLARVLVLRLLDLPPLAIIEAGLAKSIRAASMLQSLSRISREAVRLVAPQAMTASSLRNDMLYSKLAKLS